MLKLVIRFLLTCCILLWGGHARTSQAPIGSTENAVGRSAQGFSTVVQSINAFFTPAHATGHVNDPFEDAEAEEDEKDENDNLKSSKKHCGAGNGGMAYFYQLASAWGASCSSCRLPFCEHLYTSAKFIIHCVIRI